MMFKQRLFTVSLGLLSAVVLTDQASALYDPGVGRFCSRDPIGYRDSISPYSYCQVNPTRSIDPYGKLTITGVKKKYKAANCGNFDLQWRITPDDDFDEGMIVQRLCIAVRNTNCDKSSLDRCCTLRKTFSCYVCFYEILRGENINDGDSFDTWGTEFTPGNCGNHGRISYLADVRSFSLALRDTILAEKWDKTTHIVKCSADKYSEESGDMPIDTGTILPGDSNLTWWNNFTSREKTAMLHTYDCCDGKQFNAENEEIRNPETLKVTIQPVDAFFSGIGGIEPFREYSASALSIVSRG